MANAGRPGREGDPGRIEQTGDQNPQDYEPVRDYLRPNLLSLRNCKRILLSGPTFQNSATWCLHPWASEQITIQNITVRNPWYAQNGDGLDIDSCKYVTVENSSFDVGDDAICLKSGKMKPGACWVSRVSGSASGTAPFIMATAASWSAVKCPEASGCIRIRLHLHRHRYRHSF